MKIEELGSGRAVLLLHGTPSPASDWRPVVEALVPAFCMIVPELPGYGASPAIEDPSIERVGDLIDEELRTRGIDRLHAIVGYSTGAYRALDLALRHRPELNVIVTLAGMARFDDDAKQLRRSFAAALAADPAYLERQEMRDVLPAMMMSPGWRREHPADDDRVRAWSRLAGAQALQDELLALAAARDLRPELRGLRARVVARVGSLDVGAPPAWSREIVDSVPAGELQIVDGAGHALLIEDVPGTVRAVVDAVS